MKKQFISAAAGLVLTAFSVLSFIPAMSVQASDAPQCGDNSIIRCGVYSEQALRDNYNKGDIARVYSYFGIALGDINGLQEGRVYKDGRITVGSKVVAFNAQSSGRENRPGSTQVPGTNAYVGPTQNRFVSDSLSAFVKVDASGNFKWAVIKACGNPAKGTVPKPPTPPVPPTHPAIDIEKDVSKPLVNVGEQFTYTIRVKNTGDVDLINAHVVDRAPANIEFVPNSGTQGTTVSKTEFGVVIAKLAKGETRTFSFKAKFTKYVANDVVNQACVIVEKPAGPKDCDTAQNRPKKPPVQPQECKPGIPVGDERCNPVTPVTPTPETPEVTVVPAETVVTEVPSTGPAEVISGAMGVSSLTYGVSSFLKSRRSLKDLSR